MGEKKTLRERGVREDELHEEYDFPGRFREGDSQLKKHGQKGPGENVTKRNNPLPQKGGGELKRTQRGGTSPMPILAKKTAIGTEITSK